MGEDISSAGNLFCQNETCPHKDKKKYPLGKGVDPAEELVKVELLIRLPRPVLPEVAVSGKVWLCFTPCLDRLFATAEVKRHLSDFAPSESVVRWKYYADHRYVSVTIFARVFPRLFEDLLHSHSSQPRVSFTFSSLFTHWLNK